MANSGAMTTSSDSPDTLTVAQAADALGVSERTVWRYLKAGRIAGETIGSPGSQRTLIAVEAIEALSAERGGGGQSDALRAERDRLAEALRSAEAERDRLRERVSMLQRAVAEPYRPGPVARAADAAMSVFTRARALRPSV
ncbi:MAG: helix-turn-helix domain-containing protein [Miltoncostaeaceae bacterium]